MSSRRNTLEWFLYGKPRWELLIARLAKDLGCHDERDKLLKVLREGWLDGYRVARSDKDRKIVANGEKWCNKCGCSRPLTEFYPHKYNGFSAWCKECTKKASQVYRKEKRETAASSGNTRRNHNSRNRKRY